ncbi:DUF2254 domain-containing protein [Lacticigenium naphthae]|uniref:DUF2254 domain-containing protein n=1 Tax=Lacticigenium naphthae TaxID=515351 RepID=UPI00041B0E1E|nr:DUF2254 domain-containing protein [Lacticigenium naphthae]
MIEKWNLKFQEKKIWVTLGGFVFFSFSLAIVVISFDMRMIPLVDSMPSWALTSVELAKEILSLLAGSLFSVATFTFATMLTIITLYTSNFSPRAVENFLLNKTSMQTLGVFLGGFIYCLASLFFMRSSEDEYLVISATIALFYALASVIYFIRFVYNSSNFVQLDKLINSLYEEADQVFDKHVEVFEKMQTLKHLPEFDTVYQYTLTAEKSSYVEYIQLDSLTKTAEDFKGILELSIRVGLFVSHNQPVATFYSNRRVEDEEELRRRINNAFSYEREKSTMYDPNFARSKLTEVALRAVSPGINDPNTAIHILHYKSLLEAKLATLPGKYTISGEVDEEKELDDTLRYLGCVFYRYNDFAEDLHEGYWQLVFYMQKDISGVNALFDALATIAYSAHPDNVGYIKEYNDYLYNMTSDNFQQPFDQQIIERSYETIKKIVLSVSKEEKEKALQEKEEPTDEQEKEHTKSKG